MTNRSDILAALAIAAAMAGFAVTKIGRRVLIAADPDRLYTCEQLRPYHQQTLDQARAAFEAALTAKGLRRASLAPVVIGEMPGLPTIEELDQRVGRSAHAWEIVSFVHDGAERRALAGEIITYDAGRRPDPEFVTDRNGDVWRVKRAPRTRSLGRVNVDACEWGCWGGPPSGMAPPHGFARALWLLPDRAQYRGEVMIEYDEPVLEETNVVNCPAPA